MSVKILEAPKFKFIVGLLRLILLLFISFFMPYWYFYSTAGGTEREITFTHIDIVIYIVVISLIFRFLSLISSTDYSYHNPRRN